VLLASRPGQGTIVKEVNKCKPTVSNSSDETWAGDGLIRFVQG